MDRLFIAPNEKKHFNCILEAFKPQQPNKKNTMWIQAIKSQPESTIWAPSFDLMSRDDEEIMLMNNNLKKLSEINSIRLNYFNSNSVILFISYYILFPWHSCTLENVGPANQAVAFDCFAETKNTLIQFNFRATWCDDSKQKSFLCRHF